jgi:hypothetical protein
MNLFLTTSAKGAILYTCKAIPPSKNRRVTMKKISKRVLEGVAENYAMLNIEVTDCMTERGFVWLLKSRPEGQNQLDARTFRTEQQALEAGIKWIRGIPYEWDGCLSQAREWARYTKRTVVDTGAY